jgi:hypothetical protein
MAYEIGEDQHKTLISKWGSRKTGRDAYGSRIAMKEIVIKHRLGFNKKNGKTAYRSETRHVPV